MHYLKRVALTVLAGLVASTVFSTPSNAISGGEILKMCVDFPGGDSPRQCRLYIQSMIGFVNSDDPTVNPKGKLCIGEQVPLDEVVKVINEWLSAHPNLHDTAGYDATYGALAQRYRCN